MLLIVARQSATRNEGPKAVKTTQDIEAARKFSGSLRELGDEATRLHDAGEIDGYSIKAINREFPIVRVMGVRIGTEWSYLAND